MKKIIFLFLPLLLLIFSATVYAANYSDVISSDIQPDQVNLNVAAGVDVNSISETANYYSYYIIDNFQSKITINRDTGLKIVETIDTVFNTPKHGIYRIIPVIYSANGKTINGRLKVISVTDENNNSYQYETSRYNQSIQIKIGNPDVTLSGKHTYVITYIMKNILQQYKDHDELYWNVTGSEWDTEIEKASVEVISSNAEIMKTTCFAGTTGITDKNCISQKIDNSVNTAKYKSNIQLGSGRDMTIVLSLNPQNALIYPNFFERILIFLTDNWGYPLAFMPVTIILYFWLKKGRDKRFLSDNVYYQPKNTPQKTVSIFERTVLPLVYSPIKGLTPAQIGTIIDEKVDTKDLVAEIIELARMKHLTIKKLEKKEFIGKSADYLLIRIQKDKQGLKNYQKFLLDSLFNDSALVDTVEKINDYQEKSDGENMVLLSSLENNFYTYLDDFRDKVYKNTATEGYFSGDPDSVRKKWLGIFVLLNIAGLIGVASFASQTGNSYPMGFLAFFFIIGLVITNQMPKRTAWGYSLLQQIRGLKFYITEGKWRTEIAEKNLFLEEMLPLAVCLGVVDKLANDMKKLGINPPAYTNGFTTAAFASDFSRFSTSATSNLISSPSGKSSWSGGSGFSGGSGGGFGGGGGGSW